MTLPEVPPRKGPQQAEPAARAALKWPRMKSLVGTTCQNAIERAVFGAYSDYANPDQALWPQYVPRNLQGFCAWCSIRTLSKVTCLSESSVRRATQRLEEKRALLCIYRSKGYGQKAGAFRQNNNSARASAYLLTPECVERISEPENELEQGLEINEESAPFDPCPPDTPVPETPIPLSVGHPTPVPGTPEVQIQQVNITTPTPHAREESSGAADDSLIAELQTPESEQEFRRLNGILTGPGLNGQGRLRIAKAAAKYGFSLANLAHAFSKHSGGLNQAGGLLRFAEAWPVSTAGITDWPSCGKCLDEGFTAAGPCGCDAGACWLKKHPSEAARLQAEREGKPFCEMCNNTGIDIFDMECRACRKGRQTPVVDADGVPEL